MAAFADTLSSICQPITLSEAPQYEIRYHKLLPIGGDSPDATGDFPIASNEPATSRIGGAEVVSGQLRMFFALDLHYRQRWCLARLTIGDIEFSISLAPGEELTLRVARTQREHFTRTHVDHRELIRSLENSIQDRDVVSATRNSSKQLNWHVDANADLSLGKFGGGRLFNLGVMGGASGQINSANESSVESVHEATSKSTQQLTLMSKIEVVSGFETTLEEESTRKVKNPYRDRSLDLNLYQTFKHFDVSTRFDPADARLVIAIEIESLQFDSAFVRNNLQFLEEHLLETELLDEYRTILGENIDDIANRYEPDTQTRARIALEYLFRARNMFQFELTTDTQNADQSINQSFITPPNSAAPAFGSFESSALYSSLREQAEGASVMYATVAYFYRIYMDIDDETNEVVYIPAPSGFNFADGIVLDSETVRLGSDDDRRNFVVDIAVALAETLQVQLGSLSDSSVRNLLNVDRKNEIFRRVFGFVAFMQGAVVPMKPDDEEKVLRSRRFGVLETRITRHLQDYARHYTLRYLEYITARTRNVALARFVHSQLEEFAAANGQSVQDLSLNFDFEAAFVSENRILVPPFIGDGLDEAMEYLGEVFENDELEAPDLERLEMSDQMSLPHDGIHLEASTGLCVLGNVPDPEPMCCIDLSKLCRKDDR